MSDRIGLLNLCVNLGIVFAEARRAFIGIKIKVVVGGLQNFSSAPSAEVERFLIFLSNFCSLAHNVAAYCSHKEQEYNICVGRVLNATCPC